MLGKLLKYEIRSTSRILLPLYPAIIIMALINKLLLSVMTDSGILSIPRALMMMIYIFLIIAVFVITILVMLQRFYKNLLGEEGYLMLTLPVKAHEHILSKLITSIMWFAASTVVSLLSVFILLPDYKFIKEIPQFFAQVSEEYMTQFGGNFGLLLLSMLVALIVAVVMFILLVYTSIAIGHLANKNRLIVSFGAFIGISTVVQSINLVLATIFGSSIVKYAENINFIGTGEGLQLQYLLLYSIALLIIISVVYFFITKFILSKKLNLE